VELPGLTPGPANPGRSLPFGMIQWSPETTNGFTRKNVGSYNYVDDMIRVSA